MKPRKTRIKIQTYADGGVRYIPQHKGWLTWYDFDDMGGYSYISHTNPFSWTLYGSVSRYRSIAKAQECIDGYIDKFNEEETRRQNDKVVKVQYVKYP